MAKFNLSQLRKDVGITQKDLADILEVSQGFMSSVESGRNPFPDERIGKLLAAFPAIDLDMYRLDDSNEDKSVTNSYNHQSPIHINDKELITAFIEQVNKTTDLKNDELVRMQEELMSLRKSYQSLVDTSEKQRAAIDDYQQKIFALNDENMRLRMALLENGIKF